MDNNNEWIILGKTQIRKSFLVNCTQEEAVEALSANGAHSDRVINAWKQANNFKSPNRKKKGKK
tara:strand:- start:490 stop:681 length:192 start_codon:yes stop_codon:yes gene_type:complete